MNNVVSSEQKEKKVVHINSFRFDEKYIRAKDLSNIFVGLNPSTYDGWVRQGLLSRYKINGSRFYKLSEVKALIENSKEVV